MGELSIVSQKLQHREFKDEEEVILIQLSGPLNFDTAPELKRVLDDCFSQNIYKLIVDLGGLQRIASAGVGVFIAILDTLEAHNGALVFMRPGVKVQVTFHLFRLSNFFSITDDITSALNELLVLSKT